MVKPTLTSQRRCSEYPAEWSPQAQTTLLLPVHHWGASSPEGPNCWQHRRCCHDSRSHARELREMRCTRYRRRPALCHGQPPSPRQWSLRDKKETVTFQKIWRRWEGNASVSLNCQVANRRQLYQRLETRKAACAQDKKIHLKKHLKLSKTEVLVLYEFILIYYNEGFISPIHKIM